MGEHSSHGRIRTRGDYGAEEEYGWIHLDQAWIDLDR